MKDIFITIIVIFLALFLNHRVYGNSNTTRSNVEIMRSIHSEYQKQRYSKGMAKYMYNRIRYYQSLEDWWERRQAVFIIYEGLQKEGF